MKYIFNYPVIYNYIYSIKNILLYTCIKFLIKKNTEYAIFI